MMHSSKLFFALQGACVLVLLAFTAANLPSDLKRCMAGDGKCIVENINTIFGEKNQGDESFGLLKLQPFQMEDVIINQNPANPVAIDLTLKQPIAVGFKNLRVTRVKGFGKTPEGRHEMWLQAPFLTLLSDYAVDGKVLILPVKGEGKSNLTLIEPKIRILIDAGSHNENGKTFLDIKKVLAECKPKRVAFQFDNLFNGDKVLSENVNIFLNENWKEIFGEVKKSFYDSFEKLVALCAKSVFSTTPYDEIFDIL